MARKPETQAVAPAAPLAMLPVGTADEQEAAWSMLRRYRRQVGKLSPEYRCFIVRSLYADLQMIPTNGEQEVADAATDAPL